MKIIITNDDGIFGLGLLPLVKELASLGDICVIVPEKEMSAASHSLSLFTPVRVREVYINQVRIYLVSGTPADCVRLGVIKFQNRQTDIVVSGINQGPNLGQDIIYSGTVAAAREAVLLNKVGVALSVAGKSDYDYLAKITKGIIKQIYDFKYKGLLNINFPGGKIKGIKLTVLGKQEYQDRVHTRKDPAGVPYYWLKSRLVKNKNVEINTDVFAVRNGFISITPLTYDLTNYKELTILKKVFPKIKKNLSLE